MIHTQVIERKHINSNVTNEEKCYKIALVGNPNVGKSTLFNSLTKQNEHTGNWSGKTVSVAQGYYVYKDTKFEITDLPGTYSLHSDSQEELVTTDYIFKKNYDVLIIVANANTLERNLLLTLQTLTITQKAVLCLNMIDETDKKGIKIDIDELNLQLGIPVIKISAKNSNNIDSLINTVSAVAKKDIKTYSLSSLRTIRDKGLTIEEETVELNNMCYNISKRCLNLSCVSYSKKDATLDRLFTSKTTGIPLTIIFFALIFWLTAVAANYPSDLLSSLFNFCIDKIRSFLDNINVNRYITSLLTDGILTTISWVVSVMLPPALIFFLLFTLLEESGYLPRIAFNLDRFFKRSGTNGKSSITMLMGFGCNACGVMGCRIMRTKRERIIGILTNSFIPCNGRLPTLIAISTLLFANTYKGILKSVTVTIVLLCILAVSFVTTLVISFILTKSCKNKESSTFIFELPPYRIPQFKAVIIKTIKNKVFYVLSRAILVSAPAGAIIWLLTNINIFNYPLIRYMTDFLNSIGFFMGLDGVILAGFILGFPANEIVLPIILMIYSGTGIMIEFDSLNELSALLVTNGWNSITYICFLIFTVFHFPCSTTCFAIYKETKSIKYTLASVLLPLFIGVSFCVIINILAKIIV